MMIGFGLLKADEPVVELETDKVRLEVNAPSAGTISELVAGKGTSQCHQAEQAKIVDTALTV